MIQNKLLVFVRIVALFLKIIFHWESLVKILMHNLKARIRMISSFLMEILDNTILKILCLRIHVSRFSIIIVQGLLPIQLEERRHYKIWSIVFNWKNQMESVIIIQIKRLHKTIIIQLKKTLEKIWLLVIMNISKYILVIQKCKIYWCKISVEATKIQKFL